MSEIPTPEKKSVRGKRGAVQPRLDLRLLDFDMWGNLKPCI